MSGIHKNTEGILTAGCRNGPSVDLVLDLGNLWKDFQSRTARGGIWLIQLYRTTVPVSRLVTSMLRVSLLNACVGMERRSHKGTYKARFVSPPQHGRIPNGHRHILGVLVYRRVYRMIHQSLEDRKIRQRDVQYMLSYCRSSACA